MVWRGCSSAEMAQRAPTRPTHELMLSLMVNKEGAQTRRAAWLYNEIRKLRGQVIGESIYLVHGG